MSGSTSDPAHDPAECRSGFPKRIDSLLLGELPAREWAELRAHIAGCAGCRERYNRVALAERMLHGGAAAIDAPSEPALRRIGCAVLEQCSCAVVRRFAIPRWALVPGGAAMVAAAVALAVLPRSGGLPAAGEPEFAARGNDGKTPAQPLAATIRAFCENAGGTLRPLSPGPNGPAACGADEQLHFSYQNAGGYKDLFLFGLDERYQIKWYEPRPPSALSVPARTGGEQPIAGAVKVSVNHAPGLLRIFGAFAKRPIAAREVEAAVARLAATRIPILGVSTLEYPDRPDLVQSSLLIAITAGAGGGKAQ